MHESLVCEHLPFKPANSETISCQAVNKHATNRRIQLCWSFGYSSVEALATALLLKFSKEEENTYELVEPPISAWRAAYIGEKEESASHHWKIFTFAQQRAETPENDAQNLPEITWNVEISQSGDL